MEATEAWQQFFDNWPSEIPRMGIIATSTQESVGFTNFLTTDGLIALERDRPDSIGARKVIVPMSAITAVKMTDTGDFTNLVHLGFNPPGRA